MKTTLQIKGVTLTPEQQEAVNIALNDLLSPKLLAKYGAKALPRDAQERILPRFRANGQDYIILSAETGIGIERYTQFEKMSVALGYHSFAKLAEQIDEALRMVNEDADFAQRRIDLTLHLSSVRRGISEMSEARYNIAFYICTLFIIRPDEKVDTYSPELAEEKIADWNAEGISERDFFFLALSGLKGFVETWLSMKKEVERQNAKLLGTTSKGAAKR